MDDLVAAVIEAVPALTGEQAVAVVKGAAPLWEALEGLGLVDSFGGSESERVLPVVVKTLLAEANPLREDFR